jgi:hypothetical protein
VQALSLGLDLWILLRTLGVIVWGEEHWLHTAWGEEQEEVLNG